MEKKRYKQNGKRIYTLSELRPAARAEAIRVDRILSLRYGLTPINPVDDIYMYYRDGKLARITS